MTICFLELFIIHTHLFFSRYVEQFQACYGARVKFCALTYSLKWQFFPSMMRAVQVTKLANNPLANLAALGLGGLAGTGGAGSMNATGN